MLRNDAQDNVFGPIKINIKLLCESGVEEPQPSVVLCLAAAVGRAPTPPRRRVLSTREEASAAALITTTARNASAEMVESRLATQTTRPAFEQLRRLALSLAPTVTPAPTADPSPVPAPTQVPVH